MTFYRRAVEQIIFTEDKVLTMITSNGTQFIEGCLTPMMQPALAWPSTANQINTQTRQLTSNYPAIVRNK